MPDRRDISPVGWYVASYQMRFVELADTRPDDPSRRFLVWENTVLVTAKTPREAYRKVVKIGKEGTRPYRAGPDRRKVQWKFEGVTEFLPVYEEIGDGAEIMWAERTLSLRTIRRLAKPLEAFQPSRSGVAGRVNGSGK